MSALPMRSPERDQLFFGALKKGHSVLAACSIAGYARRSVYRWRDEDGDFEMRWDMSLGAALIEIEEEMRRRAIEGVEVPVFQHGYVVGTKRRYSDSLLARMWKTAAPDPYGDKELAQRAKRDAKASTGVQKGNETVPHEGEAATPVLAPAPSSLSWSAKADHDNGKLERKAPVAA